MFAACACNIYVQKMVPTSDWKLFSFSTFAACACNLQFANIVPTSD